MNRFRSLILIAGILLGAQWAGAQKFAFVDVTKILESMDDYNGAQKELDRISSKWQQEIAQEYDKIKGMYNRYQAEQVLLSDDARKQREEEIMNKEKEVRDLQKARFGPEGELFKKRQDLVQPVIDKVYKSIDTYANEKGYDVIFDKDSAAGIIYFSNKFDKTEELMKYLKL